jgi:hypothetical protein
MRLGSPAEMNKADDCGEVKFGGNPCSKEKEKN